LQVVPNHRERQFMQRLRGRGWVNATELPDHGITLKRLLEKRWGLRLRGSEGTWRTGLLTKESLQRLR
jgi:hypothetical protein